MGERQEGCSGGRLSSVEQASSSRWQAASPAPQTGERLARTAWQALPPWQQRHVTRSRRSIGAGKRKTLTWRRAAKRPLGPNRASVRAASQGRRGLGLPPAARQLRDGKPMSLRAPALLCCPDVLKELPSLVRAPRLSALLLPLPRLFAPPGACETTETIPTPRSLTNPPPNA
ncbi:hypothetical protein Q7P37_003960 [Cladosporium fusiforme]